MAWPDGRDRARVRAAAPEGRGLVDGFSLDVATVLAAPPLSDPAASPPKPKTTHKTVRGSAGRSAHAIQMRRTRVGGVAPGMGSRRPMNAHVLAGETPDSWRGITSAPAGPRRAQTLEAFFADSVREVAGSVALIGSLCWIFLRILDGEVIAEGLGETLCDALLGAEVPASRHSKSQARASIREQDPVLADVQAGYREILLPPRCPMER